MTKESVWRSRIGRPLTLGLAFLMVFTVMLPFTTEEASAFSGKKGSTYTVWDGGQITYGSGSGGYSNSRKCDLGDDLGTRYSYCVQPAKLSPGTGTVTVDKVITDENDTGKWNALRNIVYYSPSYPGYDNNVKNIKTEIKETDLIESHPSDAGACSGSLWEHAQGNGFDGMDQMGYLEYFEESLSLDVLRIDFPYEKDQLEEIKLLLAETCSSRREWIRISGEDRPAAEVRKRLMALNSEHIRYVLECLKGNTTSVDNYTCIYSHDLTELIKVKAIREGLVTDPPPALSEHPIGISDVIAVTKAGMTSAYYLDPNKLILLPDFFHQPADGVLITIDTDNFPLDGRKGSWMTIDTLRLDGRNLFLMLSQDYGKDAPYVVVDEQGHELATDKQGFTEECIEQIRKVLKELELQQSVGIVRPSDGKPKLEVWQQYLENGEYLRTAEITEEQNYNMIDGRANNRAPRRSIIERLQEKQSEVKQGAPPGRMQELTQESEIERNRK